MDDPPSDVEEKDPVYESDKQSDKQSERYVNSPLAASVSSKVVPQTSGRGHGSAATQALYQSINNAKFRQARDEALVADYSELKVHRMGSVSRLMK